MREVEFYAYPQELEPVLESLFDRGSVAISLLDGSKPQPSTARSTKEVSRLIEAGATNFRISIPDVAMLPAVVDSVVRQETGALRYFFLHNVGGPFLDLDVPVRRVEKGATSVRPGAFSIKREFFVDGTYAESLPSGELKKEMSAVAKFVKREFSKYVVNSARSWYFSPQVLKDIRAGTTKLSGPLEGHELSVLRLESLTD